MIPVKLSWFGLIALLGVTITVVAQDQPQSEPTPPPGTVSLDDLTFSGSRCSPEVAVTAEIGVNQLELRLTTPALTALVDPLDRPARRDSCNVILDIIYPQGWQFAISSVDSSNGNANLAQGVVGSVHSSYFFQGTPTQAIFEYAITGPYNDMLAFRSELLSGEELFGPCGGGRSLVLNNEAWISPQGTPTTEMTGNVITVGKEGKTEFVYSLLWRQC